MSIPQGLIQSYGFTQTLFMQLERRLLLLQYGDKKRKSVFLYFKRVQQCKKARKVAYFGIEILKTKLLKELKNLFKMIQKSC